MIGKTSSPDVGANWTSNSQAQRLLANPLTHVALSVGILLLDLATGPFLQFPILFVLPVVSAAWFRGIRFAVVLCIVLPIGRLVIAEYEDIATPIIYPVINCVIRVAVLLIIAYLTARTARQNRELNQQVDTLVTICAWSRTVQHNGEWISFEEYLRRRFNIQVSHGISPDELTKLREQTKSTGSRAAG
ncbi:hypothetical protein GC207_05445 [bacterium]|nr:hypothetical protein [bacterium]